MMTTANENNVNRQIGNAARSLAPLATFKYHEKANGVESLEWLDDEIERPTDEALILEAQKIVNDPPNAFR